MPKDLRIVLVGILMFIAGLGFTQETVSAQSSRDVEMPLTLESAVKMALRDNPGLAEIDARARALAAIPSQVGSLPDPLLSLNALNLPTDSFDLEQEPMTQLQLGISQAFPFPGKLGLRETAAEREAEAAQADVGEIRLGLIRDVKTTWWTLFYLDRALEIVKRNQDLLRQFVEVAQTKFMVGQGLQQDVLLAQVEHSKMLDREINLKGVRRVEQSRLNALLNLPAEQSITLAKIEVMALPALIPETILYQLADEDRPLLAALRSRIEAARARLDLAKKDFYPDFILGAAYGFRQGTDTGGGSRADFASIRSPFRTSACVRLLSSGAPYPVMCKRWGG